MLNCNGFDKRVDCRNGLLHCPTKEFLAKTFRRFGTGVSAELFKAVEKEGESAFRIRAAANAKEPLIRKGVGEWPFDVHPAADITVVHPHDRVVLKRVAIVLSKRAFCCRTDVGKDKAGADLGCQSFEIHAVPCRQGGSEDARVRTKRVVRIPADTEAIAIDRAACVETETRVI